MTTPERRNRAAASSRIAGWAILVVAAAAMAVAIPAPGYAAAADADLGLTFAGGTIAAGGINKATSLKLTNRGPGQPTATAVLFDLRALDRSKIDFAFTQEPTTSDNPCRATG